MLNFFITAEITVPAQIETFQVPKSRSVLFVNVIMLFWIRLSSFKILANQPVFLVTGCLPAATPLGVWGWEMPVCNSHSFLYSRISTLGLGIMVQVDFSQILQPLKGFIRYTCDEIIRQVYFCHSFVHCLGYFCNRRLLHSAIKEPFFVFHIARIASGITGFSEELTGIGDEQGKGRSEAKSEGSCFPKKNQSGVTMLDWQYFLGISGWNSQCFDHTLNEFWSRSSLNS